MSFFQKDPNGKYAEAGFNAGLHNIVNTCGDYEISKCYTHDENFLAGWDDEKKEVTKGCFFMGRFVRLLLLEADHADWINDTFEEMIAKLVQLRKEREERRRQQQQQGSGQGQGGQGQKRRTVYVKGNLVDPKTFIDDRTGLPFKR